MITLLDTDHRLHLWAWWATQGTDMPAGDETPESRGTAPISDDGALVIERAVTALLRDEPNLGKSIRVYYLARDMSYSRLAAIFRIHRNTAIRRVQKGRAVIHSTTYDHPELAKYTT